MPYWYLGINFEMWYLANIGIYTYMPQNIYKGCVSVKKIIKLYTHKTM